MYQYQITRTNPKTGFQETIVYTGAKEDIPEGWKIVKRLSSDETTGDSNPIEDYYPISTLFSLIDANNKESLINYLDSYINNDSDKLRNVASYLKDLFDHYDFIN